MSIAGHQGNMTTDRQRRDHIVYEQVGRNLQRLMAERGVSRPELARRVGRSKHMIDKVADGFTLTVPLLLDLADALDANLYDLVPCGADDV
jgi:DNA-binding Xre family transcriptional regulator